LAVRFRDGSLAVEPAGAKGHAAGKPRPAASGKRPAQDDLFG
jgi:hypothetical protein